LAIGVVLVRISTRRDIEHHGEALLLATAAGVLFGVSDVALKYLTHAHGPLFGLLSPWTLTAVISFVISFYASARSLQIGHAIEPIGSGAVGIIARLLAFCLVIAGAALVPAPLRATPDAPTQQTTAISDSHPKSFAARRTTAPAAGLTLLREGQHSPTGQPRMNASVHNGPLHAVEQLLLRTIT
jgi:hypothetical protein